MENEQLIPVKEYCTWCGLEISFLQSLHEAHLIELVTGDEDMLLHSYELPRVEKYSRLYYELEINIEGIETIQHLLESIEELQKENALLKSRLKISSVEE